MAAGSTSTSSSSKESTSQANLHTAHSGKNHHPGQGSAGGKAANGLSASATNGAAAGAGMNNSMSMGMGMGGGGILHGQHGSAPHSMGSSGGGLEDGDNRTRNAKAQRRHREKRKAHLKALEESVQVLTAQLEDARRQLGQAAYFSSTGQRPPGAGGGPGGPMSPQSKDIAQLSAENAFLRDENADLRRQVYAYRSAYGHAPPPPPDVKSESGFVYPGGPPPQGGPGGMSPRRQQRGSGGDHGPDQSIPSTAEGSASTGSSNGAGGGGGGYSHGVDGFTPMHQRSRSRVMSSSSAPSASPYLTQQGDQRAIDTRYPGPHMRYEAQPGMYGQQPPVPRYEVQSQHQQHHGHQYAPRQEGHEQVPWTSESGPPPFGSYAMNFQQDGGANEEWRPEH